MGKKFYRENINENVKKKYISFQKYIFTQKMFVTNKIKIFLKYTFILQKIIFLIIKNMFVKTSL